MIHYNLLINAYLIHSMDMSCASELHSILFMLGDLESFAFTIFSSWFILYFPWLSFSSTWLVPKEVQDGTQWKWLELSLTQVQRSSRMLVYLLKKLGGHWNWTPTVSGVLFQDLSPRTLLLKQSKFVWLSKITSRLPLILFFSISICTMQ